ncbi:hypothetical protein [Lysobacter sp. CA199]|uniref:hypothetical protein n=1 Tax=Lysobacter sp. CA199 TaxID=3455608 RepID=UPI003F8D6BA5
MSQSSAVNSVPAPDAEQIGRRFLRLLADLEDRDELNLARIEQATGVKLKPGQAGPFYTHDLGAGWYYLLHYVDGSAALKRGVGLEFGHRGETAGDARAICVLGFQDYHQQLRAMGFRDTPTYGEIGQLLDWRYQKGDITLAVSLWPQADENARACVKSIATLN